MSNGRPRPVYCAAGLSEFSRGEVPLVVHHACAIEGISRALDVVDRQASLDSPALLLWSGGQSELAPLESSSPSGRDVVVSLVRGEYGASCGLLVDDPCVGHAWGGYVRMILVDSRVGHAGRDGVWVWSALPARMGVAVTVSIEPVVELVVGAIVGHVGENRAW